MDAQLHAERVAARNPRPARGRVLGITPPSLVAVLRTGWESALTLCHPSALASPH